MKKLKLSVSVTLALSILALNLSSCSLTKMVGGTSFEPTAPGTSLEGSAGDVYIEEASVHESEIVIRNGFNYIYNYDLKAEILQGNELILVDIQEEDHFSAFHLIGALPTYASGDEVIANLDTVLTIINSSTAPVIIISIGGVTDAEKAVNYLKSKGVAEERLIILHKGQKEWPHVDLLE